MMKAGFLFSGIGTFEAISEQLGFELAWSNDNDRWCAELLKKRFTHQIHHCDVREFCPEKGSADIIIGGFPCQDISIMGKGSGLLGAKSSLFFEVVRIVRAVRPRLILLENSPRINIRGLEIVLHELAQLGYDAEWVNLSAADFGGDHIRERTFLFAYTNPQQWNFLLHHVKAASRGTDHAPTKENRVSELDSFSDAFLRFGERFGEPALFGGADGDAKRLDAKNRLAAVGNAVDWRVAAAILSKIKSVFHQSNPFQHEKNTWHK